MCKLFGVVEIENQHNAEVFAKAAIPYITETDNHGLGIMRLGERGVHIQRWLEPPTVVRRKESKVLQKYYDALRHQKNEVGNISKKLYALAIHGRFATCARTMQNVHPFYKDGTALMHNGIISNAVEFERTLSTCDSEALLSQYIKTNVKKNPLNLTTALESVSGYYGAIVFNDNGIVDIWRDDTATLFMAHIKGVGVVIATTQEIITKTARKCKAYITGIDEILPFVNIRWNMGINPRIMRFEGKKKEDVEIIEAHKRSVSDSYNWWNLEDFNTEKDKEAQRVARWQLQEDADNQKLRELQGIIKGE